MNRTQPGTVPAAPADPALLQLVRDVTVAVHQVRDGLRSLDAVQAYGALARPLTGTGPLSASAGRLAGWTLRETAGAAAAIRLRDGTDTSTLRNVLATIALAADASVAHWALPAGISYSFGLYAEVVTGAVEGAVYTLPVTR